MKRHFCNFFTAFISILYIVQVSPFIMRALSSGDISYLLQEMVFIIPYIIGNFIIAVLLIYSSFKKPIKSDESYKSMLVSFLGTNLYVILTWFINFRNPNPNVSILFFATIFQIIVQTVYLFALIKLGLSLTVLPEARELKTTGLYSISRHPLYVCYMIINVLNIFTNQTLIYIPVMFICNYLQYKRAKAEESILEDAFPEYIDYKKQVMFLGKRKHIKEEN